MERYLLKTSVNFSIGKRLEPQIQEGLEKTEIAAIENTPEDKRPEESVESVEKKVDEEPKPRRKYVTAEDKIQKEFKEMAEREKGKILQKLIN